MGALLTKRAGFQRGTIDDAVDADWDESDAHVRVPVKGTRALKEMLLHVRRELDSARGARR